MELNLRDLCLDVVELSRQVGINIKIEEKKVNTSDIEIKSRNSLVSYVDKNAEETIIEGLSELLPNSGFIAEEGTSDKKSDTYNWIIDPLDGTTNFLYNVPVYAVSIALQYQDEIVLGVVYEVNRDECFYAWKGGGAFLNQEKIKVSDRKTIKESLFATGFPYYDFERTENYFELLKEIVQGSRGIRRMGAAAVDLAYVACGRFDAFFEYSLQAWDVAAGALIVKEAGGQVQDFSGGEQWLYGKEMVASNRIISKELMQIVQGKM